MERLGSMLWKAWNNDNNNKKKALSILNDDNDDDDMSSWEIINNPSHDDVPKQKQVVLIIGAGNNTNTNNNIMVSDEEPFSIVLPSPVLNTLSPPFLSCNPTIDVCDRVCKPMDEGEVDYQSNIYDVEDDDDDKDIDVEYDDYDYDDDSRWLRKQRMSKVGKKVNSGMMKKSNKLPRYFYNKFV